MDTSPSLLGIDAGLWIAAAAFFGPLLAILLGLWIFRMQQQWQYSSERFLRDGVQALRRSLSILVSIHLQNYQIGIIIIRTLRTQKRGDPLTLQPDELPGILGLEMESWPIDMVLPVQELVGDRAILDWVMLAISTITLEAKELNSLIRQPIVAYYRTDPSKIKSEVDDTVIRCTSVLDAWESRSSAHTALLDRLHDLEGHIWRRRPWTVNGYYAIRKRPEIRKLQDKIKRGYENAKAVHERTEDILKRGGAAS